MTNYSVLDDNVNVTVSPFFFHISKGTKFTIVCVLLLSRDEMRVSPCNNQEIERIMRAYTQTITEPFQLYLIHSATYTYTKVIIQLIKDPMLSL